ALISLTIFHISFVFLRDCRCLAGLSLRLSYFLKMPTIDPIEFKKFLRLEILGLRKRHIDVIQIPSVFALWREPRLINDGIILHKRYLGRGVPMVEGKEHQVLVSKYEVIDDSDKTIEYYNFYLRIIKAPLMTEHCSPAMRKTYKCILQTCK